jgi:transcription elongation factor Elf1
LLGVLVLLVERKGPVKYWAAPLLLSLTGPALAIGHDWLLLTSWQKTGTVPNAIVSLALNIVLIGSFSLYFASMYPGSCPRCGHRSLIPLLRFWTNNRASKTHWCGSCGAKYWRNRDGLWQKERRSTWVDALMHETPMPESRNASGIEGERAQGDRPAALYPAPRSQSGRRGTLSTGSAVKSD